MNCTDPRPAGHCTDDKAWEDFFHYSAWSRERLMLGGRSDFEAANAIFMVDRTSLNLIGEQTAAKERIRWLSVHLAIQTARADEATQLNDLFIKAQDRATAMWHDAGGDRMTFPDSAKLMVWLYEQVTNLTEERDEARKAYENLIEPGLKHMRFENGELDMEVVGKAVERIAEALTEWFRADPGENYIEMNLNSRTEPFERYAVTVQRIPGKSPADLRNEAQAEVDRLTTENIRLAEDLTKARLALPQTAVKPTELNPAVWEPEYDDGYPTDEWLATIATLQALPAVEGVKAARRFLVETLLLAIKGISCCTCDVSDAKDYLNHPEKLIIFTTGGWSGAEDLMRAMLGVFWIKHHYVEWHAGGRHVFRVPVTDEVTLP